jgi:ABC-2 type transport system ATP-binding protein
MNIIEAHELTRVFGKRRAVDAATLALEPGTVFGLLGPNGAGKSTLLKLLVGHLRPTSGRATVLGHAVAGPCPELWRRMGYVTQARYLPGWMTAAECLRFAAGFHAAWDAGKAAQLARRLELPLDGRVRNLSRGHYVRLQIALAMGHNPELLLLDEPTSGLDPVGRHELLGVLIEEIGQRGCTVVLSSHLVEDVERMADTMAIMDAGRIVANGPVDAVKSGAAGEASSSLEQAFFAYVNRRQA